MNTTDFHYNFNTFFDELALQRQHAGRTEHLPFHSRIGEGMIRRFVPRFDMEVVISDYRLHRDRAISLPSGTAMVELSYCLQGTRRTHLAGTWHETASDSCTLQFVNDVDARFEMNGDEDYVMLGIGIPVPTFHHFMEEGNGRRSISFEQILGGGAFRMFRETIEPSASVIVKQIIQSANTANTRNLELECKVLELLSLAFRSFLFEGRVESSKLSRTDVERIKQARDIMLENMSEPPSLIELSRMIGMNDYKLKVGFKEMYGTTVFGYLRGKRLEKACLLLQQGDVNVNEASCAVGYSNPSYFAEAFREKYGINPGELARRY
ncbi:helix-turn-helix transcriptional regulator [Paenibacillus sp. OSY-SE]|uniref:helix-turn-helix transcriptional regulator n=1 Tax=Paenibacillus sp. OSY-SE TaxID=1196323 RepID=UPI0002DB02A5|nr:helix-turn-helix domain-containing protein [Paenibacillus sp. OSY-SE]